MRAAPVCALLLILTAGAASSPLAAQRQEVTVLAGGNYSSVTGGGVDKSTPQAGFQAGVSIRLPRSPMVSFQTELLVVQRRFYAARAASSLPSQTVGPRSDAPNLLFLQVPGGADQYIPAQYQDIDIGGVGELGLEVKRLSLGIRGEKSIRPLVEAGAIPTSPLDRSKMWSVSLSVEYLLRVL